MEFKTIHPRSISFPMPLLMLLFSISCNSTEVQTQQQSEVIWDSEQKLKDLGIILPEASSPVANYVNALGSGYLPFLAGKGPGIADGTFITGKAGQDLTIEEEKAAARPVAINQLVVLKAELGDLKKVKRAVKVLAMVNCNSGFTQQPQVFNVFSDLMVEIFGKKGKHAGPAVGMNSLPINIAVEVEMIAGIEDN